MNWETLLIASVPLLVAVVGYLLNKRNIDKKADHDEVSSIVDDTEKIRKISSDLLTDAETRWKNKLEEQEKECSARIEKLGIQLQDEARAERAVLLVRIEDLKFQIAELGGFIQGATGDIYRRPPGSRRSTDK
jgi:hypothetical protein